MAGPRFKKHLGQHHLIRPEICDPALAFLQPTGRRVVEIGPGGGVLTRRLLADGAIVLAIEMDPEWAFALQQRSPHRQMRIVIGDAMAIRWRRVEQGTLVAGNLPYQISTALIERLVYLEGGVERAAFLVQKEVAERLVARPGSEAYGSLSVLVAAGTEARILGQVGRGSFYPAPKVDGAFVGLRFRRHPLVEGRLVEFSRTVRVAFALRRKTLRNSLAAEWGRAAADRAVAELGLGPKVRAEELGLESLVRLHGLRPRTQAVP